MLICPLCLNDVRPGAEFLVYCTQHPRSIAPIVYRGETSDMELLLCDASPRCSNPQSMWEGVFLAHRGCRARNPFWEATQVNVSGKAVQIERPAGRFLEPDDPQIPNLRKIADSYRNVPEMWFPLALFRAINEHEDWGKMVMLTGPRQVGKTIIATMAMSQSTYVGDKLLACTPQAFTSMYTLDGGFVSKTPFLEALHSVAQLRRGMSADGPVAPTGRNEVHVRSVFMAKRAKKGRWQKLMQMVRDTIDFMIPINAIGPRVHPTISFFDFGGERFGDTAVPEIAHWIQNMHVLAAVIEIPGLIRCGRDAGTPDTDSTPDSVKRAIERLNLAPESTRRCIVVTKADLSPQAEAYLRKLGRAENETSELNGKVVLCGLLDSESETERALLELLQSDNSLPVFLIGTYNLDGSRLGRGTEMPYSIGLRMFLRWVLTGKK